jgi:class 3 adenylate cyclase
VQRQSSCAENTKWVAADMTCEACPAGTYQPTVGETTCIAKPITSAALDVTRILLIVLPAVAAVLLIAVAAAVGITKYLHRNDRRDLANAPTEGRISVLFTDIESSTKLWGNAPLSMGVALDTHHAIIRECINRNGGYEVKTAGDAFMIAVDSEAAALQLAIDIQLEFMSTIFPAAIDAIYQANNTDELDVVVDDPDVDGVPTAGWNGPHVRIGIHSGDANVVFDDVTKGYDYYGPSVNVASRVESVTHGGQICTSRAFFEALPGGATHYAAESIGIFELKGIPEPTELFQMTPASLVGQRIFLVADEVPTPQTNNPLESPVSVIVDDKYDFGGGSDTSESDAGESYTHRVFLSSMFTAIRSKEDKATVLGLLLKSWRVPRESSVDRMHAGVARRVAMAMRRELRRQDSNQSIGTPRFFQPRAFSSPRTVARSPAFDRSPSQNSEIAGRQIPEVFSQSATSRVGSAGRGSRWISAAPAPFMMDVSATSSSGGVVLRQPPLKAVAPLTVHASDA